jgi:hypothetical protein
LILLTEPPVFGSNTSSVVDQVAFLACVPYGHVKELTPLTRDALRERRGEEAWIVEPEADIEANAAAERASIGEGSEV